MSHRIAYVTETHEVLLDKLDELCYRDVVAQCFESCKSRISGTVSRLVYSVQLRHLCKRAANTTDLVRERLTPRSARYLALVGGRLTLLSGNICAT